MKNLIFCAVHKVVFYRAARIVFKLQSTTARKKELRSRLFPERFMKVVSVTISKNIVRQMLLSQAVVQSCAVKKVFSKIHRKTPVPESLF